MGHTFDNPQFGEIAKRVAHQFSDRRAFLSADRKIVVVCGGDIRDPQTIRSQFLKYLATNPVDVRMLLAEDAQKDLLSHDDGEIFYNIIEFEDLIAKITD